MNDFEPQEDYILLPLTAAALLPFVFIPECIWIHVPQVAAIIYITIVIINGTR